MSRATATTGRFRRSTADPNEIGGINRYVIVTREPDPGAVIEHQDNGLDSFLAYKTLDGASRALRAVKVWMPFAYVFDKRPDLPARRFPR